jgi:hypothetical protein
MTVKVHVIQYMIDKLMEEHGGQEENNKKENSVKIGC